MANRRIPFVLWIWGDSSMPLKQQLHLPVQATTSRWSLSPVPLLHAGGFHVIWEQEWAIQTSPQRQKVHIHWKDIAITKDQFNKKDQKHPTWVIIISSGSHMTFKSSMKANKKQVFVQYFFPQLYISRQNIGLLLKVKLSVSYIYQRKTHTKSKDAKAKDHG